VAGMGEVLQQFGVEVSLMWDNAKAEKAQSQIKKLGDELRHMAFEAAGAATALLGMATVGTSWAQEIANQSDMLGISTDALQEWTYAGKVMADMSQDEMVSSLKTLGNTLDQARAGVPEATQELYKMAAMMGGDANANMTKLMSRTTKTTDAALMLSDSFKNIMKTSPQAAARLSEMAFGTAKMAVVMKDGSAGVSKYLDEAKKKAVIDEKLVREGEKLSKSFKGMQEQLKSMFIVIGIGVAKHLMPLIKQFQHWAEAHKEVINSGINEFLDDLVIALKAVWDVAQVVGHVFGELSDALGGVGPTIKLIIEAFLAFKALSFLGTVVSTIMSIGQAFGSLKVLAPVIESIGAVFGVGLAPLLAWAAAIGAVVVGLHDIYTIYKDMTSGGMTFEQAKGDTWTGKGINKLKGFFGGGKQNANSAVGPSGGAAGSGGVTQENHFTTNTTVTVPHGTTAHAASHMVSKATTDAHAKMMIKAKLDGARNQVQ
jgi:hypothetical protein